MAPGLGNNIAGKISFISKDAERRHQLAQISCNKLAAILLLSPPSGNINKVWLNFSTEMFHQNIGFSMQLTRRGATWHKNELCFPKSNFE